MVKLFTEDQPNCINFLNGLSTFPETNCKFNSFRLSNSKLAGVATSISELCKRKCNDRRLLKFEPIVEITESISSGGTSTRPKK